MASAFKAAVEQELKDQPTALRYKGSILIIVTGVVGIISQLAVTPELADTRWAAILTGVATIATFLLNRFTKDGVTPSQAAKLEAAADRVYGDQVPFETVPVEALTAHVEPSVEDAPAQVSDPGNGYLAGVAAREAIEVARINTNEQA